MEFPDHQYPEGNASYLPQPKVLEYIHSYVDRFDLEKLIKFSHAVIRITPVDHDKWEIITKDLPNDVFVTQVFDAVFVCNGHYAKPRVPDTEGVSDFKGSVLHCHDFRSAEHFRGNFDIFERFLVERFLTG